MTTPHPDNYAAENLRDLRIGSGMSRAEFIKVFSAVTGRQLHATTLKRLEEGAQLMKVDELVAFCQYFEISPDDFVSRPVDPKTAEIKMRLHTLRAIRHQAGFELSSYVEILGSTEEFLQEGGIPPATQSGEVREMKATLDADLPHVDEMKKLIDHLQDSSGIPYGSR